MNLAVEFKSRFLRPADAMLILVGHRVGSASGTTMVFRLSSQVDDVTPMVSSWDVYPFPVSEMLGDGFAGKHDFLQPK